MTRYMRIKSMLTEEAANLKAANSSDTNKNGAE